MNKQEPRLFGQNHHNSSRDYTQEYYWGKNQFNSSFPASLIAYMGYKGIKPVYLCNNKDNIVVHRYLSAKELYRTGPLSESAFYNFEASFPAYDKFYTGDRETNVVAAYDNWPAAAWVYHTNFDHPVHTLDLSSEQNAADNIRQYHPDMIIGGPPCQDFSSAGLRNEDNGRGNLTISYAKIISILRPEWFLMENVSTITRTNKLIAATDIFKEAGYGLTKIVLNAALCGVPQKRKRFFMIGRLNAKDDFMYDFIKKRLSTKEMTVKDYFGDRIDFEFYYRHPRSYARRGIFSVNEPSPTIRGVNRPIPSGYPLHPNDPVECLDGIRPLTTSERAMIQTFPESFNFYGSKSEIEQMIGNAVPVNLGKFVASAILDYINHNPN